MFRAIFVCLIGGFENKISSFYFLFIFHFLVFLKTLFILSGVAQLIKNPPAMQETYFNPRVRKICWRRNRLPTPVFLGFPGGSAGKESTCNARDLGSIPGLGIDTLGLIPWRRERLPTPVFWPGEFPELYSPRGCKESGTTERLSLSYSR